MLKDQFLPINFFVPGIRFERSTWLPIAAGVRWRRRNRGLVGSTAREGPTEGKKLGRRGRPVPTRGSNGWSKKRRPSRFDRVLEGMAGDWNAR